MTFEYSDHTGTVVAVLDPDCRGGLCVAYLRPDDVRCSEWRYQDCGTWDEAFDIIRANTYALVGGGL